MAGGESIIITRAAYAKVLEQFGLWSFPRRAGTPEYAVVGSPASFFDWYDRHVTQTVPLYAGHSAYMAPPPGKPLDPSKFVFEAGLADVDGKKRLNGAWAENKAGAWKDVQHINQFLADHKLGRAWKLTGSGFQGKVFFKPETQTEAYLRRWERAFWTGVKRELKVEALDLPVCSDPTRVERLPFTRYVHSKTDLREGADGRPVYVAEQNYCIPLEPEWLGSLSVDEVFSRSLPSQFPPEPKKTYRMYGQEIRLEVFCRSMGWDKLAEADVTSFATPVEMPAGADIGLVMEMMFGEKLCMRTLPFRSEGVGHHFLIAWVRDLLAAGWEPADVVDLFERIRQVSGSRDPSPYEVRRQTFGLSKNIDRTPFSCHWIATEAHSCLGVSCSMFAKAFPLKAAALASGAKK